MQTPASNTVPETAKPIPMWMRISASVHGKQRTSQSPVRIGLAPGGGFARAIAMRQDMQNLTNVIVTSNATMVEV